MIDTYIVVFKKKALGRVVAENPNTKVRVSRKKYIKRFLRTSSDV